MSDRRTGGPADANERSSPRAGATRVKPDRDGPREISDHDEIEEIPDRDEIEEISDHDGTREFPDSDAMRESPDCEGTGAIPEYGDTPANANPSDGGGASGAEDPTPLTRRVDDLAARVQALEGAIGALEAEEETIRARADAALARTARASRDRDEGVGRSTAPGPSHTRTPTAERPEGDRRRDPLGTDEPATAGPTGDHADDEWPAAAEVRSHGVLARLVEWL